MLRSFEGQSCLLNRSSLVKLRLNATHLQLGSTRLSVQNSHIGRRCERAVVTAYTELRQIGSNDMTAFQACTTLYRIHHPEASVEEARRLVAEWIDHHLIRKQTGPTDGCLCEDYGGLN